MNREKIDIEELVGIVYDVQIQIGFRFSLKDLHEVISHTFRKAEMNGKDEGYVPVLLRNELEDFAMRERINMVGRFNHVCNMQAKPVSSKVS